MYPADVGKSMPVSRRDVRSHRVRMRRTYHPVHPRNIVQMEHSRDGRGPVGDKYNLVHNKPILASLSTKKAEKLLRILRTCPIKQPSHNIPTNANIHHVLKQV